MFSSLWLFCVTSYKTEHKWKISKNLFGSLLRLVLPQLRRRIVSVAAKEERRLCKKQAHIFGPSREGRVILCSYEESTISKYNCPCISYNPIGWVDRFLATWKWLPTHSFFCFSCASLVVWIQRSYLQEYKQYWQQLNKKHRKSMEKYG